MGSSPKNGKKKKKKKKKKRERERGKNYLLLSKHEVRICLCFVKSMDFFVLIMFQRQIQ